MKSIKINQKNPDMVVILILLMLFSLTSLIYLDRFPKVWMDEAGDSMPAYTFQKDGTLQMAPLVSAGMGNQDVHFLQPMIVSNILKAPFFLLLGAGSLQGRLASIFMGALTIVGMYFLSRKIGGIVFASISTVFLIFDNLFFVCARTIRPEIFVVTIAIWALYFAINAEIDFRKLFLCGLLLGISLYTHPNSFLVVVAILFIVLSQFKAKQYPQILLRMGIGGLIGFLPYGLYVVYQDGANHFHDFWSQIGYAVGMITSPGSYFSGMLTAELERYISYIFFPYRLPIFLIQLFSIGYAIYNRGDRFNRIFLIFIFVNVVLFPILISTKYSRYLTVLMPVVAVLVIKMVWDIAGWSYEIALPALVSNLKSNIQKLNWNVLLPVSLALVLLANQVGGDVWAVGKSFDCSFPPFISQVRSLVPTDAKVWGPMTFWFGFYDHPYRTPWTVDTEMAMNDFQPDYVILYDNTEVWGKQTGVTKRTDSSYESWEGVRNMLSQLVKDKGVFVGSVPNSCYGNIEVYKLSWK